MLLPSKPEPAFRPRTYVRGPLEERENALSWLLQARAANFDVVMYDSEGSRDTFAADAQSFAPYQNGMLESICKASPGLWDFLELHEKIFMGHTESASGDVARVASAITVDLKTAEEAMRFKPTAEPSKALVAFAQNVKNVLMANVRVPAMSGAENAGRFVKILPRSKGNWFAPGDVYKVLNEAYGEAIPDGKEAQRKLLEAACVLGLNKEVEVLAVIETDPKGLITDTIIKGMRYLGIGGDMAYGAFYDMCTVSVLSQPILYKIPNVGHLVVELSHYMNCTRAGVFGRNTALQLPGRTKWIVVR